MTALRRPFDGSSLIGLFFNIIKADYQPLPYGPVAHVALAGHPDHARENNVPANNDEGDLLFKQLLVHCLIWTFYGKFTSLYALQCHFAFVN